MKLLLLRVLLQRRGKDEGFTLPMVIALGLVMLLLGTANIVKSSEENLNATIQNSSSDALAVAEVGITKYRELLNQNRILTVHNHNKWTVNNVIVGANTVDVVGQTCTDMITTPTGWEDDGTAAAVNDTTKWWEVRENIDGNPGNELIGSYRLVSYEYDIDGDSLSEDKDNDGTLDDTTPDDENGVFTNLADVNSNYPTDTSNDNDTDDDGISDARGILTVQGRSPDGSEAQIRVEIPLRINQDDMNNLAPALWIGSSDSTYLGSLNTNLGDDDLTVINGNVVIANATATASTLAQCDDPADGTNFTVISDARDLPSIGSIANKITEVSGVSENISFPSAAPFVIGQTTDNPYVTPPSGETFDKDVHCSSISDCVYYYNLGSMDTGGATETDGIARVILYVTGNVTIDNNLGSSISSNYLEIYVTSSGKVTIDSDAVSEINAFIHAPDSELEVTGSGTVKINGSVWVDKFTNTTGATVEIEPDTTRISSRASVPSYELYTTTADRPPRVLTSSPTNWVREEVE